MLWMACIAKVCKIIQSLRIWNNFAYEGNVVNAQQIFRVKGEIVPTSWCAKTIILKVTFLSENPHL